MGVIYKLTQEVVDFILSQKRTTPALGCRDLAKIVSQEFTFPVSKSSVNTVLHQNRLSSPLGRRSLSGKKKEKRKFAIPPERRQQIFPGTAVEAEKPPSPSLDKGVLIEPKKAAIKKTPESFARELPQRKPLDVSPQIYENAGSVFLWALLREMNEKSPLEKVLGASFKEFSSDEISRTLDALTISKAMGADVTQNTASLQNQMIGFLCRLDHNSRWKEILRKVNAQQINEEEAFKIGLELPAALAQILYIKISLEDNQEILLDSQFKFRDKENVQSGPLIFIEKILNSVTSQIINNVQSVILPLAPTISAMGCEDFSDDFFAFTSAFENFPGKRITKITLYDNQQKELVTFDTIPEKRRYFMAGLYPDQVKFSELKAKIQSVGRVKREQSFSVLGQNYYVSEGTFNFTEERAGLPAIFGRVLFLASSPSTESEVAFVTNMPAEILPATKAATEYLLRWPLFQKKAEEEKVFKTVSLKKQGDLPAKDVSILFTDSYDIKHMIDAFCSFLRDACQQRFFFTAGEEEISSDTLDSIYRVSAQVVIEKDHIKILFLMPSGKPFLPGPFLKQAVFIFNQAGIKDDFGRIFIAQLS